MLRVSDTCGGFRGGVILKQSFFKGEVQWLFPLWLYSPTDFMFGEKSNKKASKHQKHVLPATNTSQPKKYVEDIFRTSVGRHVSPLIWFLPLEK